MLSFFLSGENIRGGDIGGAAGNGRTSNTLSPGRGGGRGGGYFFNDDDAGGGDETDGVLQDARNKLREGLRLGGTTTAGQKLSPRRLFNDLDPDGIGEVKCDVLAAKIVAGGRASEGKPSAYFQRTFLLGETLQVLRMSPNTRIVEQAKRKYCQRLFLGSSDLLQRSTTICIGVIDTLHLKRSAT